MAQATTDPNYSWLPNAQFAKLWQSFVKGASVSALMSLPEDSPVMNLSWRPITALPDRVDTESSRISFEYAVSLPANAGEIKDAKVTFASPEIIASAARHPEHGWTVSGTCDLRHKPASSFKGRIEVEVVTSTGARMHGDLPLYCRVTGPVSASPPSLYYGVVSRESSRSFTVSFRSTSAHPMRSCKAISSDPELVDVSLSKAPTGGVYEAKCIINAGTRIGERSGTITFRVETDREHLITVPYYGFIKK